MGTLRYGPAGSSYFFEDRTLSHLKIAIAIKLRRDESFLVNWRNPREVGFGRVSLWVSPAIPLAFIFDDPRPPILNETWIQALLRTALHTGGMYVTSEPKAEPTETRAVGGSEQARNQ